jgi:uncharacterized membrane protein/thiol-disulfide isomerase/thioredoxin
MKTRFHYGLLLILCLLGSLPASPAVADTPVVRAVLFYSPLCSHCHQVITEVLPPLMEKYGDQFVIVGVNVAEEGGQALYQAAITYFAIPQERLGVPTLIMGDNVLVGSIEIPQQLPVLIEDYLAKGGLDWPAVPGLAESMAANAATTGVATPEPDVAATPSSTTTVEANPTTSSVPSILGSSETSNENWSTRFARDPLGNSISVLVLIGMLVSVLYQGIALTRTPREAALRRWQWAIPPLVVLGLIVAGYLTYVETQQVAAVCGPVGDCNAVQQSEFALLFGFLPIAVLGLIGYVGVGAAWVLARYARGTLTDWAKLALVGMAWFGVAFSIYLTFLEPFVIGATCAWCLTSAVVMTLLFWVIAPLARPALAAVRVSND